ncbi:hypothetical protein NDU88_004550 [Pleurodeles waltl]|uniref:Uncharacterized protein n=1 Tax=Pleurodeles waltl TaxID=8319 RepID=A0AAV7WS67_PLEWA|nr:hypothetical protein NDU88_004550 [Pleurodeles waltl]
MSDAKTLSSDRACGERGCLCRRGAVELGAASRGLIGVVIEERPWSAPCVKPEQRTRAERSTRRGRGAEAMDRGGSPGLPRRAAPCLGASPDSTPTSGLPQWPAGPLAACGRDEEDRWRPWRVPEAAVVSCTATRDVPRPGPRLGLPGWPE